MAEAVALCDCRFRLDRLLRGLLFHRRLHTAGGQDHLHRHLPQLRRHRQPPAEPEAHRRADADVLQPDAPQRDDHRRRRPAARRRDHRFLCRLPPHHGPLGELVGLRRVHRHGLRPPGGPSAGSAALSARHPLLHAPLLRQPRAGGAAEQPRLRALRLADGAAALPERTPAALEGGLLPAPLPLRGRGGRPVLSLLRHRLVLRRRERGLRHGHALLCPHRVAHAAVGTARRRPTAHPRGLPPGPRHLCAPDDPPGLAHAAVDHPAQPQGLPSAPRAHPHPRRALLPPGPGALRRHPHPRRRQSAHQRGPPLHLRGFQEVLPDATSMPRPRSTPASGATATSPTGPPGAAATPTPSGTTPSTGSPTSWATCTAAT